MTCCKINFTDRNVNLYDKHASARKFCLSLNSIATVCVGLTNTGQNGTLEQAFCSLYNIIQCTIRLQEIPCQP